MKLFHLIFIAVGLWLASIGSTLQAQCLRCLGVTYASVEATNAYPPYGFTGYQGTNLYHRQVITEIPLGWKWTNLVSMHDLFQDRQVYLAPDNCVPGTMEWTVYLHANLGTTDVATASVQNDTSVLWTDTMTYDNPILEHSGSTHLDAWGTLILAIVKANNNSVDGTNQLTFTPESFQNILTERWLTPSVSEATGQLQFTNYDYGWTTNIISNTRMVLTYTFEGIPMIEQTWELFEKDEGPRSLLELSQDFRWGTNTVYTNRTLFTYYPPANTKAWYHEVDQDTAWLCRVKYRFSYILPLDEDATLQWREITVPDVGGAPQIVNKSLKVRGTGKLQQTGEMYIEPPQNPGIAYLELPKSGCDGNLCGFGNGEVGAFGSGGTGIEILMSLGRGRDGSCPGLLSIQGELPGLAMTGSSSVAILAGPEVTTSTVDGNQLIAAPDGVAVISDLPPNNGVQSFQISFYAGANASNYGSVTARVWTFSDNGSSDQFIIDDGNGNTSSYEWSPSDQSLSLTAGGGLKRTTERWPDTNTRSYHVNNGNAPVFIQTNLYRGLYGPGGAFMRMRIQTLVGSAEKSQVTQWVYNENTNSPQFGLVMTNIQPDGSWTKYQYDSAGRVTQEISSFMNASLSAATNQCRVKVYDYTAPASAPDVYFMDTDTPRLTIEYVLGPEVSRQYTIFTGTERLDIQCVTANTNWDAPSNLITTNRYYSRTGGWGTLTIKPNGTEQLSESGIDINGQRYDFTAQGEPDSTGTNVLNGTQTTVEYNERGDVARRYSKMVSGYSSPLTLSDEYYFYQDTNYPHRLTLMTNAVTQLYRANAYTTCCLLLNTRDEEGVYTYNIYDALNRQCGSGRSGITNYQLMDAYGNVTNEVRVGRDGSAMVTRQAFYDLSGRLTLEYNALNQPTSYGEYAANGYYIRATTNAEGGTQIQAFYPDGQLASVTGTAVTQPQRYEYGVANNGLYTKVIKLDAQGNDTPETTTTYTDMLGRTIKISQGNDVAVTQFFYNSQGQQVKQVDPDGIVTLMTYNAKGEPECQAISASRGDTINYLQDQITKTTTDVFTDNVLGLVRRTETSVWLTDNANTETVTQTTDTTPDGNYSRTTSFGRTYETVVQRDNGYRYVTSRLVNGPYTVSTYQGDELLSTMNFDADTNGLGGTSFEYDMFGRQRAVTDARVSTVATNGFNEADQVFATSVKPVIGTGQLTQYGLDGMGRVMHQVLPDNGVVTNLYNIKGQLLTNFGARTYPVSYAFDEQGRPRSLTTTGAAGTATTLWDYDPVLGVMTNKFYATTNQGPAYTYSRAGRPTARTWARGITTTYATNAAGQVTGINYSGGASNVALTLDRKGKVKTVVQGSMTTTIVYNDAGQVLTESYSGGILDGVTVTNSLNSLQQREALGVTVSGSSVYGMGFGYDSALRLSSVTYENLTADYTYWTNSSLVSSIVFKSNDLLRLTISKNFDALNRLYSVSAVDQNNVTLSAFAYTYNSANQRTRIDIAGSSYNNPSYWQINYDALGQVIAGLRKWTNDVAVSGQQFEYTFDSIGNRLTSKRNGRQSAYGSNLLNQITSLAVPSYLSLLGTADSNATVTVNLQGTERLGEYFHVELPVNNSSNGIWFSLTNIAVLNRGTNTDLIAATTGHVYLAKSSEIVLHDLDGNLTNDGTWHFTWNAENRLIAAETTLAAENAGHPRQKLELVYDWRSRRMGKIVYKWTGSWTMDYQRKYIYDNWNLLVELDDNNQVVRSYVWGNDLSGSIPGSGGVSGLLMVNDSEGGSHFVVHDGNGNVALLVNTADSSISAVYEHGPFGELIRATGPMAFRNPFRFSTKYMDNETGLYYFGFRYYDPTKGMWLSRDPLSEKGGENLYAFLSNDPVSKSEFLGLGANDPPISMIVEPNGSAMAKYSNVPFEWHHPITWNNTTRNFQTHALVKRACYNLKTEQKLIALGGHAGPHADEIYHNEVERRLSSKWRELGPKCTEVEARVGLEEVIDGVLEDIRNGKLKLYRDKAVFEIPDNISFKRPDGYGYVRRNVAASKNVQAAAGKVAVVVNIVEHVKAIIFFASHRHVRYDWQNDIFIDLDDGSTYDGDGHYIGTSWEHIY